MKLERWLMLMQMSPQVFAEEIDEDVKLIDSFIRKDIIPKPDVMIKIYQKTLGSVTPNDFYGLSEELFQKKINTEKNTKC